ncbi:MAG: hypothetical protein OEV64_00350 [Desulfobulbaceae bacterium]|nr:hypothetical protein [Desulfobulbaceae bacterium]
MSKNTATRATEEQLLYADILAKGMYLGLVMLLITFALYVTGIMAPVVPLSEIQNYWHLPVDQYLAAINADHLHWEHAPTGWSWVKLVGKSDFLNFTGVAVLSGVTIICYIAIIPGLLKRGDKTYAIMSAVEVLVLALAASGLLAVGH